MCLDFDGTLSEIVADPVIVREQDGAIGGRRQRRRGLVEVLSGQQHPRDIEDPPRLGDPGGLHVDGPG